MLETFQGMPWLKGSISYFIDGQTTPHELRCADLIEDTKRIRLAHDLCSVLVVSA